MKKYGIYNAGPLFTEAEWNQRKREGEDLRKNLDQNLIDIWNPVDYDFNGENAIRTNKIIFDYDYSTINKSNFAIFDLDTSDSGTLVEFGIYIEKAMHNPDIFIIVKLSDFRAKLPVGKQEIPNYGINGFVSGALQNEQLLNIDKLPQIYLVANSKDALQTVKDIINVLEKGKPIDNKKFYENHSKLLTHFAEGKHLK